MWQLRQEKAGIGTVALETIARGHCFGTGSMPGQGQDLLKNQQQGQQQQAQRASGVYQGLQPQEYISSRTLNWSLDPQTSIFVFLALCSEPAKAEVSFLGIYEVADL